MGIISLQGSMLYVIVVLISAIIIITIYALIKYSNKKSMEILFKKPFYKDKPEDIKNKILNNV